MRPGDVDWEQIFGDHGARWFHCGGIFAGLSETTAELAIEAMRTARPHGTIVSCDLNYRPSLWKSRGGPGRAAEVNQRLVISSTCCWVTRRTSRSGSAMTSTESTPSCSSSIPTHTATMLERVLDRNPKLSIVASTLRQARSATINDWGAVCRTRDGVHFGPSMPGLEIFDRVGGGDSFASGFFYGLMSGRRGRAGPGLRRRARRAGDDHAR